MPDETLTTAPAAVVVPQGALNALMRSAPAPLAFGSPERFTSGNAPALVGKFVADRPMRLVQARVLGQPLNAAPGWTASVRIWDGKAATPLASGPIDPSGAVASLALADQLIPAGSVVECGVDAPAGTPALDMPAFTLSWTDG